MAEAVLLAHHQPSLHTSLRKVLEDVGNITSLSPLVSTALMKDYRATLNSPSTTCCPGPP